MGEHDRHLLPDASGKGAFFQRARAPSAAGEQSEPSQRGGFARSAEKMYPSHKSGNK